MIDPDTSTQGISDSTGSRWTSPRAWWLAWIALRKVVWVRVALWRWPYARVRSQLLAERTGRRTRNGPAETSPASDPLALAWSVGAASRRVPFASCLTQALALETLMEEAGLAPELRIGVARNSDTSFEAHAWVEFEGRILIGGIPDMERFAVLPAGVGPQGRT